LKTQILTVFLGPFEVESTLKSHPAVVESAVVGVADAARGENVKAFVVLEPSFKDKDPGTLKRELQDHCKKEAAPYKYPRVIEFVSSEWLPKTTSGKIKRAELRRWEREATRSSRL
jgi:adenosine deaminase CECR1